MMDMIPIRRVDWDRSEEGFICLCRPKFESRWMNRLILKWGVPPTYRIRLDAYGSAVWERCDGKRTVLEIAEQVKEQFAEVEDSVHQRVGFFLNTLAQQRCIILKE